MAATLNNLVSMMKARRQREEWEWKRRAGKKNYALSLEFMRRYSHDVDAPPADGGEAKD